MSLILSGTDGLSDVDGSAATPAIRGTDANTGIFFPAADTIAFSEGGVESMRIDSSGNVGIGTASPSFKLDVANAGGLSIRANNTSSTAVTQFRSTNTLTTTNFGVDNVGGFIETAGAYPTSFYTNAIERARITSGGDLLVGLTSQTSTASVLAVSSTKNNGNAGRIGLINIGGSSNGSDYPQIGYNTAFTATKTINYLVNDTASWIRFSAGKVETFTAASGTAGNAISPTTGPYVAQGGTSWTNSSDERLKDIIEPITDATNKVSQLRAVIGKFKTDPEDKRRSFLIAQDVQAVLPEAVDVSDPESLGVQYTDVIPLLVAAIKEQQAIITQLQADVASLQAPQGTP